MLSAKRVLHGLVLLVGLTVSGVVTADTLVDVAGGVTKPSASGYDHDLYANASVGYRHSDWVFRLGYMDLGEFELENATAPAEVSMSAPYIAVHRQFDTGFVVWEVGVGLAHVTTEARLHQRLVDERDENAPFLELVLVKQLNRVFAVKAGYLYLIDVGGSDVSALSAGVRLSF